MVEKRNCHTYIFNVMVSMGPGKLFLKVNYKEDGKSKPRGQTSAHETERNGERSISDHGHERKSQGSMNKIKLKGV